MEPYQLAYDQAGAAGAVLGAAFLPSAVARYLVPNPERRGRILPVFFTAMTRLAIRHGRATAVGSPPQAVALWIAPEEEPDDADYAAAGMLDADALMDAGERDRLAALDGPLSEAHARVMSEPHWYLPFLGVVPATQGQGVGSLVMRSTLEGVIPPGVPSYLDSTDERNLPFYERLGFRVMERGVVPGSQLRTWSLRRG